MTVLRLARHAGVATRHVHPLVPVAPAPQAAPIASRAEGVILSCSALMTSCRLVLRWQVFKRVNPSGYGRLCPNGSLDGLAQIVKEGLTLDKPPPKNGTWRQGGVKCQHSYPVVGYKLVDNLPDRVAADIASSASGGPAPLALPSPPDPASITPTPTPDAAALARVTSVAITHEIGNLMSKMALVTAYEHGDFELANAMTEYANASTSHASCGWASMQAGMPSPPLPPELSSPAVLSLIDRRRREPPPGDSLNDAAPPPDAAPVSLLGKQVQLETGEIACVRAHLGGELWQVDIEGILQILALGNRGGQKKYTVVGDAPPPPFASPTRRSRRSRIATSSKSHPAVKQETGRPHSPPTRKLLSTDGQPAEPDGEPTGPASAQEPPSTGGQPTEPSGEPTGPASPLSTEAQGPSPMNLELKRACEEREARAQTVSSGAPPRAPQAASAARSCIHTTAGLQGEFRCLRCDGVATFENPLLRCRYAKEPHNCDKAWHRFRCCDSKTPTLKDHICCMEHHELFESQFPGAKYLCPDSTDAALPPIPMPPK